MKSIKVALALTLGVMLVNCQSSSKYSFEKNPVDELIRENRHLTNYSILLHDMDYQESDETFLHQYRLLYTPVDKTDTLVEKITDWKKVSPTYFEKNQENMGMALVTKNGNEISKIPSPPGYNQYVGNEKYGQWKKDSSGSSFWEFYGKYAFMSSMFNLMMYPVGFGMWNNYRHNYGYGRPYYGDGRYGTSGRFTQSRNSSWKNKGTKFQNKVRGQVKQSASKSRKKNSFFSRRQSRSGSRYNGSSFRSRGRGFGK